MQSPGSRLACGVTPTLHDENVFLLSDRCLVLWPLRPNEARNVCTGKKKSWLGSEVHFAACPQWKLRWAIRLSRLVFVTSGQKSTSYIEKSLQKELNQIKIGDIFFSFY